jgi:hypothetical protein
MKADDEGWVTVTKSTKKKVRNRKRKRTSWRRMMRVGSLSPSPPRRR